MYTHTLVAKTLLSVLVRSWLLGLGSTKCHTSGQTLGMGPALVGQIPGMGPALGLAACGASHGWSDPRSGSGA